MKYEIDLFKLKHQTWVENLILFLFCFAILFGPAYALFDSYNYDVIANPDIKTYLGLANFDFGQSPIRKYRVIIPLLASGFNYMLGPIFSRITPHTFPGPDFSMCMSFLIVNSIFMSVFGMLVYRLCKEFVVSGIAVIVGLLSVLTCRWTSYYAGLPGVDSLYLVIIAMTLLGIKTQNSKLIIVAIFIGPWAKESFIFVAPLLFFFSSVKKWKLVVLFGASGFLVFLFRYYLDMYSNATFGSGLNSDLAHIQNITASLKLLFSFQGIYQITSVFGMWSLLFVFLLNSRFRAILKQNTTLYLVVFLFIVLIHLLLSSDIARMLYLASPVFAIWFSSITEEIISIRSGNNI
jgi:hypothetical protein